MSKITRLIFFSLFLALTFQLAACKKKETPPSSQPARVSATKAYEHFFGPAPTTDKGTCYAFVIYFPSAKEKGKVVPFPFFTFDEASLKKVAVERLIGGMDTGSYKGEFLSIFPSGTHLLALEEAGGMVTARFSKEMGNAPSDAPSAKALSSALALTLGQFVGVKEVRMQIEGQKGDTVCLVLPESEAVMQPGSPRLLSVTAMKEKGEKDVAEVDAFFDRPVDIKELVLTDKAGKTFEGDVYHSVFDMAAVLKPKDAAQFKAGMPVKVRWKAMDKVGRTSQGEEEFSLEVKEH
ncbi:MAG: GerMN domain-containing protein [Geobacter sp.]|nr:GerMN domain-containing protein [Geobacter sp.]